MRKRYTNTLQKGYNQKMRTPTVYVRTWFDDKARESGFQDIGELQKLSITLSGIWNGSGGCYRGED